MTAKPSRATVWHPRSPLYSECVCPTRRDGPLLMLSRVTVPKFEGYAQYKRQVHVIETRQARNGREPTKGFLASRVAREMQRFIVRSRPFPERTL